MTKPESYSAFNPKLEEEFPIDNLLSRQSRLVVSEGLPGGIWNLIFMNSPAQNAEAEMLMGRFVTEAVKAGEWVDLPAEKDRVTLRIVSVNGLYELRSGSERPQRILQEIGFVEKVLDDEGKEMLRPTRKMAVFIKQRLARLEEI